MTHTQENSYDKAVNSWHDAQIRYGQAWPYIKKAGESVLCLSIWLKSLEMILKHFNSNQNSADGTSEQHKVWDYLPDKSKIVLGLYGVLKVWYGNNKEGNNNGNLQMIGCSECSTTRQISNKVIPTILKVGIPILTAVLYHYAKDPQDGKKIVEQTWCVLKDCVIGSWNLAKAAYYFIDHYGVSESEGIQSDTSPTLNGEEGSLPIAE